MKAIHVNHTQSGTPIEVADLEILGVDGDHEYAYSPFAGIVYVRLAQYHDKPFWEIGYARLIAQAAQLLNARQSTREAQS